LSSLSSGSSSVVRPPSSRTSNTSVVRKPIAKSRPPTPVNVERQTLVTAPDPTIPAVVASSHSQQRPVQYRFYGPVTVYNYNVPGGSLSSSSLVQHMLTKGGEKITKGMNEATFGFKGIAEATNAAKILAKNAIRGGLWSRGENRANRFEVGSPSRAAYAPVSVVGEVDRVSVPEVQDDVGGIAPLLPIQEWHVTNPDLSRSTLNTPESGRSLRSGFPMRQAVDVFAPRTSTSLRSVTPHPQPTTTQRGTPSPTLPTISMVLDVNGDAVTPPSDRQSWLTGSPDDGSFMDGPAASGLVHDSLMPCPLNTHKKPLPVPQKPSEFANASRTTPPAPPSGNRNPVSRYLSQQEDGQAQWLQQPVQFPIMFLTQGPRPSSPDSITATALSPGRVNVVLNRRS
jgi:hypothetical protein